MADSTSLILYDPRTADPEVIDLAGFLAGYAGRPRGLHPWRCVSPSTTSAIIPCRSIHRNFWSVSSSAPHPSRVAPAAASSRSSSGRRSARPSQRR